MPFLLMVFLTLICLPAPSNWPIPFWSREATPLLSALWTGVVMLLPALYAARLSRWVASELERQAVGREWISRRYERGRFRHQIALYACYGLTLCLLGWGRAVSEVWQWNGHLLPGAELVILVPFLAGLLISWCCFYEADRAAYLAAHRLVGLDAWSSAWLESEAARPRMLTRPVQNFSGRATYLLFQAKQKLALVSIPIALLLLMKELQRQWPEWWQDWQWLVDAAGLVLVVVVFAVMPWILRFVLGLRPLPSGAVRDRLLAAAKRLHFRCSDILVWNTQGGMANALVVGVAPWLRYVVFTDRLLEEFSEREIEAVLGHEVGHVKHHHMLYYLVFLTGSLAAVGALVSEYQPEGVRAVAQLLRDGKLCRPEWLATLGDHEYLQEVPMVVCVVAYIFLVFGFVSRRCERQADVFGCRAVSCARTDCQGHDPELALPAGGSGLCPSGIQTFIGALEKVATVNGIHRDRPGWLQSWQHATIGQRVEFLRQMLSDPALEQRFHRRVALLKWGLLLALGAAMLGLLASGAWTI